MRVTVTSASYPPRSLSTPVYTVRPSGTATSPAHSHCRAASASRPRTAIFANEVWSNRATFSRAARCSAALGPNQFCRPQPYSVTGVTPGGANQLARSQPCLVPKLARRACSRWCTGERRTPRELSGSRFGQAIAKCRPTISWTRLRSQRLLPWNGENRRMSTGLRSRSGSPATIHRASAAPAPPPNAIPEELKPAATK